MRKVGIVTLFGPENYGNRLQAYALAKTIQKLNCEAVETYYCDSFASFVKGKIKTSRVLRTVFEFVAGMIEKDKGGFKNNRRVLLFYDFIKQTRVKLVRSNNPSIDYFVCGSDQIWNPAYGGTPYYFAAFAPKAKRISYAASFGVNTLSPDVAAKYTMYLKDMAHISVREDDGAALVKELTGRNVPVVLDPTLLLSREEWCAIANKPKFSIKERYALTYFLGWHSDDIENFIIKTEREYGLQIISLNEMYKNQHWFGAGPAEFLWLIQNASLVCTNSFHATVFSIIMKTPFVHFKREATNNDMSSRIDTLLGLTKLNDRVYGRVTDENMFVADYDHVDDILEKEKVRSIAFLKEALNIDG